MKLKDFFRPEILYLIAAVNILGTIFGFYYYFEQLVNTSMILWIFVPASPLATFFLATSVYLNADNRGIPLLDALAFLGNFKYGLWTVFVLLYYSEIFFMGQELLYVFMFFSHLGMAVQAFLVFYWQNFRLKELGIVGAWFLLNDLVDYTLGTHTYLYTENVFAAEITAYTLTVTGLVIGYIMIEKVPSLLHNYGSQKI